MRYGVAVGTALFLIRLLVRLYIESRIRHEYALGRGNIYFTNFAKERMYWGLVKDKRAKAWPYFLSTFGIIVGFALGFISIMLSKSQR